MKNVFKWLFSKTAPEIRTPTVTVTKRPMSYIQKPDEPPVDEVVKLIEQKEIPPCFAPDTFRIDDRVVCIDDSPDIGPFGPHKVPKLKKGAIYNVFRIDQYNCRGEVLCVHSADWENDGYESRHFNLVKRTHTGDDPTPRW